MSARTFAEWQAYSTIEPFGPPAEFWRAGMIAAMLCNIHRKKQQKPFTPYDFMPKDLSGHEPAQLNPEQEAELIRQNFQSYADRQKGAGR